MAYVVSVTATQPGTVASFTAGIGPTQANDMVLVLCAFRVSGTISCGSGYTSVAAKATTDSYDSQWFVKKTSGNEVGPVIASTGTASAGAIVYVIRDCDFSGTDLNAISASGTPGSGSTGATLTSHALATGATNCLIVHGFVWDGTSMMVDHSRMNVLANIPAMMSGTTFSATNTTIGTFTVTGNNATNAGRAWAIAIKNGSGGDLPVRLNDGRAWLQNLGGFATLTTGIPDSVSGLTAIDGVNMNTVANTLAGTLTVAAGIPTTGPWAFAGTGFTTTQNLTAEAWVGAFQSVTSTNVSGKLLSFPFGFGPTIDNTRIGSKGLIVVLVDNTNKWGAYQVLPQSKLAPNIDGVLVVKPGTTALLDASGGAGSPNIDYTAIVNIGYFHHRKSGTATSVVHFFHPPIIESSTSAFVGGGADGNASVRTESLFLLGGVNTYPKACSFQGSGQLLNRFGVQYGDGSTATYINHQSQSYELPNSTEALWRAGESGANINIKAASGDTMDFSSSIFSTESVQSFTIDAAGSTGAAYNFSGTTLQGFTVSDNLGLSGANAWTNVAFKSGGTVTIAGGGGLTNCTITKTISSNAALSITANGSVITRSTIDCTKSDGTFASYCLELGTAVTAITLTDVTFSGTPGTNKVHVLKTTGTVTITISGTTSLSAGDVTSAGAMVEIAAPSPTLDATVLANTRIVLWNRTTSTELDNVWITGTAWSKAITSGASSGDVLDLYTFKEGYQESVATVIYSGADATFAVQQVTDDAIQYYRTAESITDYTTLTEFNFYAPSIYIQSDDTDGATSLKRMFIFYNGALTTEDGARYMRGGVTFRSAFDVVINRSVVPMAVDNVSATLGLYFTDESTIRVTTDDGTSWIAPPSAPGSIRYAFGVSPGQIETGVSGLTGPESAQLMALPGASAIAVAVWDKTLP